MMNEKELNFSQDNGQRKKTPPVAEQELRQEAFVILENRSQQVFSAGYRVHTKAIPRMIS